MLWFTPGQKQGRLLKWRLEWPRATGSEPEYATATNLGNGTWVVEAPAGAPAYLTDNTNNWIPAGTYSTPFKVTFENLSF